MSTGGNVHQGEYILAWHEALAEEALEATGSYLATRDRVQRELEGALFSGVCLDDLLLLADEIRHGEGREREREAA